jgi:cell division initiation protein
MEEKMAITPEMISEKSFASAFRGYNMDEVDDFLDEIMDEMESLIAQNNALKEAAAAPAENNSEEIVALKAQLSEVRAENKALEGELSAVTADNKALAAQMASASAENKALYEQIAANGGAAPEAAAELAEAKSRIIELEKRIAVLTAGGAAHAAAPAEPQDDLTAAIVAAAKAKIEEIVNEVRVSADQAKDTIQSNTDVALAQIKSDAEAAGSEVADTRSQIHDIRDRYLSMLQSQMKVFSQLGDE